MKTKEDVKMIKPTIKTRIIRIKDSNLVKVQTTITQIIPIENVRETLGV